MPKIEIHLPLSSPALSLSLSPSLSLSVSLAPRLYFSLPLKKNRERGGGVGGVVIGHKTCEWTDIGFPKCVWPLSQPHFYFV